MAKIHKMVYIEETLWRRVQDVFDTQGTTISEGFERTLKTLVELDDAGRALMLRQVGMGNFQRHVAQFILDHQPEPATPRARDAARTDPDAKSKPRRKE